VKIVSWNINGIKARIDGALTYLRDGAPDVLCLQEIKTVDEGFPAAPFEELGYRVATHGQKGFNGVAILSRFALEDVRRGLPGEEGDAQARYMEATVAAPAGSLRVASIYLPNGNPKESDKFAYKLAWMRRLAHHVRALLEEEERLVLAGDYNVIPQPADAKRPEAWKDDALFQPEARGAFRGLLNLGLVDAVRDCHPEPGLYTFWDYQAGAWQKDDGIRIDHLLLSPEAADRLAGAGVDRFTRGWEKPSDHAPAWVDLELG
jgi:exodeoxyribonuclease-3